MPGGKVPPGILGKGNMDGFITVHAEGDEWEIDWVVVGVGDARGGPHHQRGGGMGALQRALVEAALDFGDDVSYALRKERAVGWGSGAQTRSSSPGESPG